MLLSWLDCVTAGTAPVHEPEFMHGANSRQSVRIYYWRLWKTRPVFLLLQKTNGRSNARSRRRQLKVLIHNVVARERWINPEGDSFQLTNCDKRDGDS
jgi:hypothetical protein